MRDGDLLLLPVHGFVLAGGKSFRMGQDKATLCFRGSPMVEVALEKLRSFCAAVAVSGNRSDLASLTEIVPDHRTESGPAAGIESGLRATTQSWAMFIPVDVPLLPKCLLRAWANAVLDQELAGVRLSFLRANGDPQPAFCMLHRDCQVPVELAIEEGERKLSIVFARVARELGSASTLVLDAENLVSQGKVAGPDAEAWFSNVNTPEDLSSLEAWPLNRGLRK